MSKKCQRCGKEFTPKRSTGKYCSPNCRKRYNESGPLPTDADATDAKSDVKNEVATLGKDELLTCIREALRLELAAMRPLSPAPAPVATGNLGGLKPIAGSEKPLPGPSDLDDLADTLDVKNVSGDGGQAAMTFINRMLSMQSVPSKPKEARAS